MSFNLVIQGSEAMSNKMLKRDEKVVVKTQPKPTLNFSEIFEEAVSKLEKEDPELFRVHMKAKNLSLTNKFHGRSVLVVSYKPDATSKLSPFITTTGAECVEKSSIYCIHGMWFKGMCTGLIPKELHEW